MLHHRSSAAVAVLLLLTAAAVWNPAAAQEYIVGMVETRDHQCSIDTVKWKLQTTPFPITHITDGWGGRAGITDTFNFPGLPVWPIQLWILYNVDAGPELEYFIPEFNSGEWYELPTSPYGFDQESPRVVFEPRTGIGTGSETRSLPGFDIRPNPTPGPARLSLQLDRTSPVNAAVYAPDGRLVRELARTTLGPGTHEIRWDGTDSRGTQVPSGVYLCLVEADGTAGCRRLVVTN